MTVFDLEISELSGGDDADRRFRDSVDRLSAPTREFSINFASALIEGDVRTNAHKPLVECSYGRVTLGKGLVPAAVCVLAKTDCAFELWAIDRHGTEHLVSRMYLLAGQGHRIDIRHNL